jgi:hypothetical protein
MGTHRAVSFLVLCALLPAGVAAAASSGGESRLQQKALSVAGVQKVIQMLTDMLATAKQEKNDEEVAFAKFTTWCTEEKASLTKEIAKNAEDIDLLTTEIAKLESDIGALGEAIAGLQESIASDQASVKTETSEREKSHADYLLEQKDYSESVSALERAIAALQKEDYDRPAAAAALLQLSDRDVLPAQLKSVVTAFLAMKQQDPLGGMDYNAPEANAYEFQSGGIITMLKGLLDKFRAQLTQCEKEEMNSQYAYDMIKQDLRDSIENAEKDSEEKTALKELKTAQAAEATKQLGATKEMKAANEKSLADTTTECSEKDMSYQEKQNLRTQEIEAINKAIEILDSPEVLGNAETYLELVQQGKAKALALIQAAGSRAVTKSEGVRSKLRRFLMEEGQRLRSQQLVLLAQQLGVTPGGPFEKVKTLIDNLITRLEEETKADADHEGYCDTELGKSKITRTRLSEEIDALEAEIEAGKANIMALSDNTATLTAEVADLVKSMAEATELKKAETKTNEKTVEDATALVQGQGKAGMQQRAAGIDREWGLKKTIKMGSEEWNALANPNYGGVYDASADTGVEAGRVDTGHKEGMQTFGATYQGQQDESDYGVLPMLEVIHSEFANLEADTVAAEDAAMKAYKAFMIESNKNKAVKDRKIEMNNADQAAAEAKLQSDITDLKATQDELLAADRYHAILVPKCIDKGQTFDERQGSRQEEIDSLKHALHILNSEDISTSA